MYLDIAGTLDDGTAPVMRTPVVLRLPRGATARVRAQLFTAAGVPYAVGAAESVVFSVKKTTDQIGTPPGFTKTVTGPVLALAPVVFAIVPLDTRDLDPGMFVYDLWLVTAAGAREPLVLPTAFILTPAVTPAP